MDESGFLLIPNVARTWAPRGETPLLRHSFKRKKISTLSAVTVSPQRQRLGLYVQYHDDNITGVEVVAFLRSLLRHLRGPVVVVWDQGQIHKRDVVKKFLREKKRQKRLYVYRFPGYAPELNPDEFVWTQLKKRLSNSVPEDVSELLRLLRKEFKRLRQSQRLLWSCIYASKLPWS